MIICITNYFDKLDAQGCHTGKKELLVDFAFDQDTLKQVVVPCVRPEQIGAKFNTDISEWVIEC